jgi:hypothetical protein
VRNETPNKWMTKIRHFLLDLDARIDSTLFSSGAGIRELYERFSTFMDRFYVGRWKRWVFIEPLSEAATIGLGGLILMLALAVPAFRETADEDWLKKSDLAVTFLDRYGNVIGSRGIKHNDSIPLEEFPDHLIKATLATEDRRFYDHFGIDIAGTARALVTNAQAGGVRQGGSSITQQLAKNLFLSNERTIERKVNEAFLAIWLETRLTKNEILKLYLDRAYMGGGTFGVDGAAHFYFNKSARDVNLAEAAMLAGLFKAPTKYAPHINLPAARARANVVLDNLVEAGFMSEGQVFGARRNPATAVDRRDENSPNYYLDWAFDEMRKLVNTFPKSYTERVFVVRTAIDMNVQRAAEGAIENQLRQFGRDYHATQAATVVSDLDGGIRAMVGGRDYGASQFNRAVDAMRQPGSSFKPYVYTTALLNGFKPTSIVVDGPVCIGNWCPQNYGPLLLGRGDPDASHHPLDQRGAGETLDRTRRQGRSESRPRQDHRDRTEVRHHGAAARHPVAADRLRRGQRGRTRGGVRDIPQQGQGGEASCRAGSQNRRWRSGLAFRSRRQEADPGDPRLGRRRHGRHDEPRGGRRHRAARAARRHSSSRQDRHHQQFPRRLVRWLHRQLHLRGLVRQRRLLADQPHDRRLVAGTDLARHHGGSPSGRRDPRPCRRRRRQETAAGCLGRGLESAGGDARSAADPDPARRRYPGACREADGRRRKNRLEDIVKRSGDAGGIPEAVVERAGLPRQLRGRDAGAFGRQRVGRSAAQELIRHIVMTGVPCG